MPRKARGRMLWGSISTSERVNRLSLKACLLYTWLLAHADDQGRMPANPDWMKANVCPMRKDIRKPDIERSLAEMETKQLIKTYRVDACDEYPIGGEVLQITDWWEYQTLREPKASRYPPPKDWDKDRIGRQPRDRYGRWGNQE